ncbi:MAG: histidine kinase [Saprospiraceae bacterium]|nr:histidine kinase [Saprospiraceae bacterium]
MRYQILVLIPLLLLPCSSWEQNFFFRQYTTSDGLPSSNVFAFDQDSDQLLWMGTSNGLCSFDGKQFTAYSIEDGLVNNLIYGLSIDPSNRKWLSTMAGQPSYFQDGRGHIPAWADTLAVGNYYFQCIDTFIWFSGVDVVTSKRTRPVVHIGSDQRIYSTEIYSAWEGPAGIQVDSLIYFVDRGRLFRLGSEAPQQVQGLEIPDHLTECQALGQNIICIERSYDRDRIALIEPEALQVTYQEQVETYQPEKRLNTILVDTKGHIWLGLQGELLYLEDWNATPKPVLRNVFVNDLYHDHEGNLWVSTEGKGMYLLISSEVQSLKIPSRDNYIVRSLEVDQRGNIHVGYISGRVDVFDKAFNLIRSTRYSAYRIVDILTDETGAWVATNSEVFRVDTSGEILAKYTTTSPIKSLAVMSDSLYVLSYSIQVIRGASIANSGIPFSARIYTNYTIDQQHMWLGSTDGLFKFNGEQTERIAEDQIYTDIRGISKDHKGRFWVATAGQGVFVLQGDSIVQHITTGHGLSSNLCMHQKADGKTMWVSTNLGINKIDVETGDIQVFNEQDGLSTGEVKYLGIVDSFVLAASSGGVDIFPKEIASFVDPPLLKIKALFADKDTLLDQARITLPYHQNDLVAQLSSVSFKSLGNITYAYQLEGLNKDWIETASEEVSWAAVPPGDYQLKVKVKGSGGTWSETIQRQIIIRLPWWRQWWFLLTMGLIIAGTLFFAYQRQQAKFKRESELQRRMQNLQLTALRAQMNPHFMFNALSSIQEFINNSDLESANLYLSRFASLVRSVLNHSTQERISLEEEVSQLELYLTLENLRFDQRIHYDLLIKRPLQANKVFIPTMIIQPFVENALNHGLFHRKEEKKLEVRFQQLGENMLHCQIEDNGIGRQRSMEINEHKKYKGKSKGIQVTRDRLELINKTNEGKIAFEIEDLADDAGNPSGTLVHLMIPFSSTKDGMA